MKFIVISSKDKFKSETPDVVKLLIEGLDIFHLRKPKFTESQMEEYINLIPVQFHNRIVIHSFHNLATKYNLKGIHLTKRHKKKPFKTGFRCFMIRLKRRNITISTSCHDLLKLPAYAKKYDYVFLSPVFDSISKGGRQAAYAYGTIQKTLKEIGRDNVFALGGISKSNLPSVKKLGFGGAALLGSIWNSGKNPVEHYLSMLNYEEESPKEIEIMPNKVIV